MALRFRAPQLESQDGLPAAIQPTRGSTSIEYVVIAALVSVGIIAALTAFADASNNLWAFITKTVLDAI